jgi:hypothetical protein
MVALASLLIQFLYKTAHYKPAYLKQATLRVDTKWLPKVAAIASKFRLDPGFKPGSFYAASCRIGITTQSNPENKFL